ncbi:MAG: YabP/YqfC family sporulation protein [Clostridiales bacterium]|jgi:sporulation protein YqfC|nr:YabP/YqfC family sporulation protein [Clostridiales bacterium]
MVFLDDLKGKIGADGIGGGRVIVFGGGVYVEGHKGVAEFSESEITFFLPRGGRLNLSGKDFRLSFLSNDGACVTGKVENLSFK